MSLHKQLWLAVTLLLLLVFCASSIVNGLSARSYLEQQLSIKNADNANMLALLLGQQAGNRALQQELLSNQFNTGFYELIQMTDPAGEIVLYRVDEEEATGSPAWFMKLLPIAVDPGVAAVMSGGQQSGTVTIRGHSKFAYHQLWQGTQRLAVVFLLAMLVAGSLGTYFLKFILKPLEDVKEQAKAIGERRFISIDAPPAEEFHEVVTSMNKLSRNVQQMLAREGKQLEKLQHDARADKVTGLINREPFMQALERALRSNDADSTGSVGLIRIRGLAQLNQVYGRSAIDAMLKDAGVTLNRLAMQNSGWAVARLNGSDLILLAPREEEATQATKSARDALQEILRNHSMPEELRLPAAATMYKSHENISGIMTRLDGALLAADQEGTSTISVALQSDIQINPVREQMDDWRKIFTEAFDKQAFSLESYPLVGRQGEVVHLESPVRLKWKNEILAAGQFLPWISRLKLSQELDKHVVELALQKIESEGTPISINLAARSLVESAFLGWISERLSSHARAAEDLWLEIPEGTVFRHLDNFKRLANRVRDYGCRVGIEHVGHQLADLGQLHDVGVDYLKVDAGFVRGIDENTANQTILRTLCTVGHSIGLKVFAEGVQSPEEWTTLRELGADGATGPGITV